MTVAPVGIRPVTADDADLLFAWANDPAARAASFSTEPIARPDHVSWLRARLSDPSCRLWIGLAADDGTPFGVVRFEPDADGRAVVSINVAPEARGRGLGNALLRAGLVAARRSLHPIGFRAWVRADNVASVELFRTAGFAPGPGTTPGRLEFLMTGAAEILHFAPAGSGPVAAGSDVCVVHLGEAPPTGSPDGARSLALREVAGPVMSARDLFAETTDLLDRWAADNGIVDALAVDGASFWFYRRLSYWWWLHERLLWLAILDALLGPGCPADAAGRIEVPEHGERALAEVAGLVAARDGAVLVRVRSVPAAGAEGTEGDLVDGPPAAAAPVGLGPLAHLRDRWHRHIVRRRQRWTAHRTDRLIAEGPGRLLVLTEHARQRVDTPAGPRFINAYLDGPIERLRSTALAPIELELDAVVADDERWARLRAPGSERTLPVDVLVARFAWPGDLPDAVAWANAIAAGLAGRRAPLEVGGIDLGPALLAELIRATRSTLPARLRDLARARRLLAELRPAGILLANEYGRPEWIAAGRLEGVPTAAVQHGIIHRWHPGYLHRTRPASLPLVDRTYLFGDWERRLLTEASVYRPEELVVVGSPRLDLVAYDRSPGERAEVRAAVRAELGVAPGDRLIVVSTSFGPLAQRFYTMGALAGLVDRPLPGIHLCLKLHPREAPDEPYTAAIRARAAAGGFPPPALSVIQRTDLYRLLAAADAHLGVHSTVLTEAVVTGTPNLLAMTTTSNDLLGYVEAGVAIPVRDGGELLRGVERALSEPIPEAIRRGFLEDHFRPGVAADRIRDDLLSWLGAADRR